MKGLKRKVISILLMLILTISGFAGYTLPAEAAEIPTISVSPQITNSYEEQVFIVYVSCEGGIYEARYGGTEIEETLAAGENTLSFPTSETVQLMVHAPYDSDGDQELDSWTHQPASSANAYYINVNCLGDDGQVLQEESVVLSKYDTPEVTYNAPESFDLGEIVYTASNPSLLLRYGQGDATITYSTQTKRARSFTVNFLDEQDQVLHTYSESLDYGEFTEIVAPATYEKDGKTYQLESKNTEYQVGYDDADSVYTFEYGAVREASSEPYEIVINLLDTDNQNALLYSIRQTVDVDDSVYVALPTTYEVNFKQYRLKDGTANYVERDFASNEPTVYNVPYTAAGEMGPYDITINFVDYNDPSVVLSAMAATVTADGEPYIYDVNSKQTIDIGDAEYKIVAGQGNDNGQIVHTYGTDTRIYQVYYTAEKVEEPANYMVTMRYISIDDNTVLATQQEEIAYGEKVTFEAAPGELSANNIDYVRLNGQEGSVTHEYNDGQTSYAAYYRDSRLEEPEEPVVVVQTVTQYVTRDDGTVVENEDRTVVPVTVPVTTVTDEEGNQSTYNTEGQPVEINDGQIVTLDEEDIPLNDGIQESEPVETEVQTEAQTTVIPEEEVPQKAGIDEANSSMFIPATIGIVASLIIIAAVVVFFLRKFLRKN